MNIANQKRTTKSNEGKNITFTCSSGRYLVPPFTKEEKEELFEGFEHCSFVVLYTYIHHDKGWTCNDNDLYIQHYDNGLVGYQGGNFYKTEKEAKASYEICKKYTPKVGTIAYCDVFLVNK